MCRSVWICGEQVAPMEPRANHRHTFYRQVVPLGLPAKHSGDVWKEPCRIRRRGS